MKPIKVKPEKLDIYSVAPYNFVSFPEKAQFRYKSIYEIPKHDSFLNGNGNELLNGYISYRLEAQTPIIVAGEIVISESDKEKHARFFVNSFGQCAIPGNAIRGMIKTNAYILSSSSVVGNKNKDGIYEQSNIEDSRFLYRAVADGSVLNKKYNRLLGLYGEKRMAQNVKVGYMFKKGNKYYIKSAAELIEGVPYLRIDEIELRKRANSKIEDIKYMYDENLPEKNEELKALNKSLSEALKNEEWGKAKKLRKKINEILEECYNGEDSKIPYESYATKISFEYDKAKGKVTEVDKSGSLGNEGYILSSDYILGKRSHYIVPMKEVDSGDVEISDEQIERYIDDLIMTKKAEKDSRGVKPKYKFWALPEYNEKKPVFYINIGNELHFGFTPYLRVLYSKSVLDGVPYGYKNVEGISYVDGMFGFSNRDVKNKQQKVSYKSRVSFEDAVVVGEAEVDKESSIKMLLAEPKPTSYNLYLMQKKEDKKQLSIYDGDDFRIRGIKQYWLKNYVEQPEVKSESMSFTINPLEEGTSFEGKIYFNNLYDDELGLLLWSLKLNEGCQQNIGLAKPYGFGRVKVEDVELYIEDLGKKYSSFCFDYSEAANPADYVNIFKNYFSKEKLNGKSIDEQESVKELIYIKSKVVKKEERNKYRYMSLKRKYQYSGEEHEENEFSYKKVLPEILKYDSINNRSTFNKNQSNSIQQNSKQNNYRQNTNKTNSKENNNTDNKGLTYNPFIDGLKDFKVKE